MSPKTRGRQDQLQRILMFAMVESIGCAIVTLTYPLMVPSANWSLLRLGAAGLMLLAAVAASLALYRLDVASGLLERLPSHGALPWLAVIGTLSLLVLALEQFNHAVQSHDVTYMAVWLWAALTGFVVLLLCRWEWSEVYKRWPGFWKERVRSIPSWPYSKMVVLLVAALLGGFFGNAIASPTPIVEQGQFLAGIIPYRLDSVHSIYQAKLWNGWAQLAAAGLDIGLSEAILSMAVYVTSGALQFAGLALLMYALTNEALLAWLAPFLILPIMHGFGFAAYQVYFVGGNYGGIGMAFALFVVGLLAVEWYPSGFFLLGLSVASHPSIGVLTGTAVGIVLLLDHRRWAQWFQRGLASLPGLLISVVSLLWQRQHFPVPQLSPAEFQRYQAAAWEFWDVHRSTGVDWRRPEMALLVAVLVLGLMLMIMEPEVDEGPAFVRRIVVAIPLVGMVLVMLVSLPIPALDSLNLLMPARFMNMVFLIAPLFLLGEAYRIRHDATLLWSLIAMLFLWQLYKAIEQGWRLDSILLVESAAILLFDRTARSSALWSALLGAIALSGLAAGMISVIIADFDMTAQVAITAISLVVAWSALGLFWKDYPDDNSILLLGRGATWGLILLSAFLAADHSIQTVTERRITASQEEVDRNAVLAAAVEAEGGLLSVDVYMSQYFTRRFVTLDPFVMNTLAYAPEAGPVAERMLEEVYGIDYFNPPSELREYYRLVPIESIRVVWEKRSPDEWLALGQDYGFTQVISPSAWLLRLPAVFVNESYTLYDLPINER